MKIERILSILFYLLNRESVSGKALAEEFGVSRRTIIRDIDTLSLAGIPIYSEQGANGGYSIQQDYQLSGKILTKTNAQYILLALNSLKSVYGTQKIKDTYEKVAHLFVDEANPELLELDFSVVAENHEVMTAVSVIKQAIVEKRRINFNYTSPKSGKSQVTLDPLQVTYKWYGWYVLGYSHRYQAVRQYKLVRLRELTVSQQPWLENHEREALLQQHGQQKQVGQLVEIRYPKELRVLVEEYLPGRVLAETADFMTTEILIIPGNFMSYSMLLGFADRVKVINPPEFVKDFQGYLSRALQNNLEE